MYEVDHAQEEHDYIKCREKDGDSKRCTIAYAERCGNCIATKGTCAQDIALGEYAADRIKNKTPQTFEALLRLVSKCKETAHDFLRGTMLPRNIHAFTACIIHVTGFTYEQRLLIRSMIAYI